MARIKLVVAYDGTNYSGWQVQNNGITIEGVLNKELSELLGEDIMVIGAGRTDAGVHSMGNVCVFDSDTRIPAEKICFAMNSRLPEDIRVIESCEVEADFHPRHVDSVKTYEYHIWNDRFQNPMVRLYTKFTYQKLDVDKMQEAADILVGEHDFASFCSAGSSATTTVRTITELKVFRDENEPRHIIIRVSGNGFLYNMVRIISGTLIEIGDGSREVSDMKDILEAKDRSAAGRTAEASGLRMIGIRFFTKTL